MIQPLLCSVPYGLSWGWIDWLVLGVCVVGFNIKFVSSMCSGGESGTKTTPSCNLQKKKKNSTDFKKLLECSVRRCLFSVVWFWEWVCFLLFFTGISMDIGQKELKYN